MVGLYHTKGNNSVRWHPIGVRMKFESDVLDAVILTTFDCNFACKYCFEDGVKKKLFLDQETADLIIKYLCRKATECRFPSMRLTYYGGEPLMNVKMIEYISRHIGLWAKEQKISFEFGLVTNGSLLSPEVVVVAEGDQIMVKVLEIDRQGKIRLSRKEAMPAPTDGSSQEPAAE